MRASDRKKRFEVVCGQETGLFDLTLFGPGGGSRCIQFGEHLITPIEFEALAGKKARNWKINLKVEGKPIKTYFENNVLKTCDKSCDCTNCVIGRKYPTDLELLIEKVYLNKTYDLSIVKKEKEDKNVKKRMLDNPEDKAPIGDVKDEFFSSPESTPKKKKRSSLETPVDEILPLENSSPTTSEQIKSKDVTSPIHVVTVQMPPITDVSEVPEDRMIRDEMAPSKQQKDIRSFFGSSPRNKPPSGSAVCNPTSPGAKSDCSVELLSEERPKRRIVEVDLTDKSPMKSTRGPGRPKRQTDEKTSCNQKKQNDGEDLLQILRQEKEKALSPRKKLPRDAKSAKESDSSHSNNNSADNSNKVNYKTGDKRKIDTEQEEPITKRTRVINNEENDRNGAKTNGVPVKDSKTTNLSPDSKKEKKPSSTPVKIESPDKFPLSPSPSKIPTYTTMIKSALEDMNCVGGEGCTKLEILLYILRKFKPKGNVEQITTKLIEVLETGTKKGDFLSSVSCPRVLKKDTKEIKNEKDIKREPKDENKSKSNDASKSKKSVVKKINSKGGKLLKVEKKKSEMSQKKKTKEKETNDKPNGHQIPKKLLEPLSTICKAKKLTRREAVRKMWVYIKLKKLQDPSDKSVIICDDNMKKLTKCKKINQNDLMKHLKSFMIPLKTK